MDNSLTQIKVVKLAVPPVKHANQPTIALPVLLLDLLLILKVFAHPTVVMVSYLELKPAILDHHILLDALTVKFKADILAQANLQFADKTILLQLLQLSPQLQ